MTREGFKGIILSLECTMDGLKEMNTTYGKRPAVPSDISLSARPDVHILYLNLTGRSVTAGVRVNAGSAPAGCGNSHNHAIIQLHPAYLDLKKY